MGHFPLTLFGLPLWVPLSSFFFLYPVTISSYRSNADVPLCMLQLFRYAVMRLLSGVNFSLIFILSFPLYSKYPVMGSQQNCSQQWWEFWKSLRIFFTDIWHRLNAPLDVPLGIYTFSRLEESIALTSCHETNFPSYLCHYFSKTWPHMCFLSHYDIVKDGINSAVIIHGRVIKLPQ